MNIQINSRIIGPRQSPYIIAELSGNHNGDRARLEALIVAAAKAGADAVKLQTYTADSMTLDLDGPDFTVQSGPWAGRRLYDLYREAATPLEWHAGAFKLARDLGLACFSSPFSVEAVDFLETLDAPAYKIASFEILDHDLIKRAVSTERPVIVSTGMASFSEIRAAWEIVKRGRMGGALLHCVSAYPAPVGDMRLSNIQALADSFNCPVGLSDHSLGIVAAVSAVALGACLIEKHLCLSRAEGGVDAAFSLEPDEFALMVRSCREAHAALNDGRVVYGPGAGETDNARFRRSLYFVEAVGAGEVIERRHVRAIRPGRGLAPVFLKYVVGARASRDIDRGTPVAWDLLL